MTPRSFHLRSGSAAFVVAATLAAALALSCAAQRKNDAGTTPGNNAADAQGAVPSPDLSLIRGSGTVVFQTTRGEVAIKSDIVDTPAGRTQGLMYRRQMAPETGMVFVFPYEEVQSFWMKNTFIPLDIIFVSSRMEVVGVAENAVPHTLSPRTVGKPSKYVVEVVGGLTRVSGIVAGTKVRFENIPLEAAQ